MKNLILVLLALFFTLETFAQTIYKREKNFNFGDGSGNRVINFDRNPDGDTVSLTADTALFRLVINKDIYGQGDLLIDGASQFNSPLTLAADLLMTGTGALDLPVGTDLQRPATPNSGMIRFNSDSVSFEGYDGSAWGSLGGGVGAPYIYEVYDFEGAVDADDFTCGSNFTVTNDTSTPLNGNKSIIVAQGATPPTVGVKCTGPNISVPVGARGLKHVIYIPSINGFNSGDIAVNVYDVTNTKELGQALLNASTTKKYTPLVFTPSSTTANIRIEFEVLVQNASASAEFDDIYFQDRLDPVDIYASSDWEDCGMTASDFSAAFGSVTSIEDICKRDGSDLIINVKFVAGTVTGGAATITPRYNGSTITIDSVVGSNIPSGTHQRDASIVANSGVVLISGGDAFVEFGPTSSTGAGPYTARPADEICTTGANCGFEARIPIAGWTDKENYVAVKGTSVNDVANTNSFSARIDNDGVSCTIVSENINIINGASCTRNGAGDCVCDFNNGVFSVTPTGQVVAVDTNTKHATFQSLSASSFRVISVNELGAAVDTDFLVSFSKQGTDFVTESERTVLFNGSLYPPSCYLKDVRSAGTNGGTSATSYDSRVLNTASGDCTFLTQSGGTTGTNGTAPNFTLNEGKYEINCRSPYLQSGYCKSKLVNTTDISDVMFGTVVFSDDTATEALVTSELEGTFEISSSKTFQLQYKCTTATATFGQGATSVALGDIDVYSQCKITKLR